MKRTLGLTIILFVLKWIPVFAQVDHIKFNAPILYPVEPAPGYITGADFNKDGKIDILVTSILWGGGDLLISRESGYNKQSNSQDAEATMADTGDFNNDGWVDYAIATNQGVRVCINDNGSAWTVYTFLENIEPMALSTADFDHDNYIEIAVATVNLTNNTQILYMIEYDNNEIKVQETNYPLTTDTSFNYLRCMDRGDFDNDGYEDIVVSFTEDCYV